MLEYLGEEDFYVVFGEYVWVDVGGVDCFDVVDWDVVDVVGYYYLV